MTELTCALGPDNAGDVLSRLLREARMSIDAAVYEIGPSYRWMLASAVHRGVRVRLLLDNHASDGNALTALRVRDSGGQCRVPERLQAHAKLLVIDERHLAVGTGNLIWRDAPRHAADHAGMLAGTREWWAVVTRSPSLSRQARARFEEIWAQAAPPPARWEGAAPQVAPPVGVPRPQLPPHRQGVSVRRLALVTGGAAIAERLVRLIAASSSRVLVIAPYVDAQTPSMRPLTRALAKARDRGVTTHLLLGSEPSVAVRAELATLGIEMRAMDPLRATIGHAKGVVADGTAVVMSANWSATGMGQSFEAALAISEPAAVGYFADAWARDWAAATPV